MSIVRWIIWVVIFLVVLSLSFANADQVTLRFFGFGSWQAPLMFIVFCAFALGVTCGLLAGVLRVVRLNRELKKVRKELQTYEKEKEPANDADPVPLFPSAPPAPPVL
ncbi:MAG: LapA family protein [Proteobacteria bacterium]|nr:LapA family protein [Pseudomonadota bacterium]MCL2307266.1 LapA family protein [Pseudomonadota bacterium]